ncbi:MAG: hypothetical protein LIO96_14905 [Lachnospiraceae bacterium]|nr:hypothetical protein [Lachnospiraceae bacterium]
MGNCGWRAQGTLWAGRHTEIEMFAGTIIRIGKEFHVPTPFCEFAYEAIKAMEEQNDGLFSDWTGFYN